MNRFCIILANLMDKSGELNRETKARIDLAVQLEGSQQFDVMLVCGWDYRPDCKIAIADSMRQYLLAQHPRLSQKVICQRFSRDTVGDAVFSRILIDELIGFDSNNAVYVTTSDYHVNRAKVVFEFVFGTGFLVSVNGTPGFGCSNLLAKEEESLATFKKTFSGVMPGETNSIYATLRKNHPFYNGCIHPKINHLSEVIQALKISPDAR